MVISSYVIQALPEKCEEVAKALTTYKGVEVHEQIEGRLVVSIEAESTDATYELATRLSQMSGVVTVNLVYCNFEDETLCV